MNRPECMSGSITDPRTPPNGPDWRIEVEIEKSEHECYSLEISGDTVFSLSVNRTVVISYDLLRVYNGCGEPHVAVALTESHGWPGFSLP